MDIFIVPPAVREVAMPGQYAESFLSILPVLCLCSFRLK